MDVTKDEKKPDANSQTSGHDVITSGDESGGRQITMLAKFYHSRYKAASDLYKRKKYCACREACKELLMKAQLPRAVQCQTLQLLASCSYYYHAKNFLEDALGVCDEMESINHTPLVTKLRQNTLEMIEELESNKPKQGEPVPYIKKLEYDEDSDDDGEMDKDGGEASGDDEETEEAEGDTAGVAVSE